MATTILQFACHRKPTPRQTAESCWLAFGLAQDKSWGVVDGSLSFHLYHAVLAFKAGAGDAGLQVATRALSAALRRVPSSDRASRPSPEFDMTQLTFTYGAASKSVASIPSHSALMVRDTSGSYRTASDDAVLDAALAIIERRFTPGDLLQSPLHAKELLVARYSRLEHEVFTIMFLNAQNKIIKISDMFRGTVDSAAVYPREVVKAAILNNASSVVLAHNHPSGGQEPSSADRQLTSRLREALSLIDVKVLDHLVVAGKACTSFAERGWL